MEVLSDKVEKVLLNEKLARDENAAHLEHAVKEIVDVRVPQEMEEVLGHREFHSTGAAETRTVDQTADPTAPQRLEGHVEVIQPQLPEERVQQHMMTRRQVPASSRCAGSPLRFHRPCSWTERWALQSYNRDRCPWCR